jgi:hypothetical protein
VREEKERRRREEKGKGGVENGEGRENARGEGCGNWKRHGRERGRERDLDIKGEG